MQTAWEVLLWLVLALGITFIAVIWGVIVFAVSSTVWSFIKTYKKVSKEIDEEEAADDGPQYKF
ncbi:membrane protein [Gordonia phage Burley]|nr:membrane protein [Gordonia phage Burley]